MSEYTLVKKESITKIADAIRAKGGITGTLTFPDDFCTAIANLQSTPQAPTTETLVLAFHTGETVYDSNSNAYENYVAVGHSSNYIKNDAVWKFTPSISATAAVFTFTWDNTIGAVGWPDSCVYRFQVTTNGVAGQGVDSNATEVPLSGTSGTETVSITGLNLTAGTTYYIRANYKDYTTKQNLKAFVKAGNTVQLTT